MNKKSENLAFVLAKKLAQKKETYTKLELVRFTKSQFEKILKSNLKMPVTAFHL